MILLKPKVGAKHELLFNKPVSASEASLLNKSSCLAAALGVTKLITVHPVIALFLVPLVVLLESDLDVQQIRGGLVEHPSLT
jgi:hypothetical protein